MDQDKKDELLELMNDVEDVLELDDEYLMNMMKETPDALITMLKEGYAILHTILVEALDQDNEQ